MYLLSVTRVLYINQDILQYIYIGMRTGGADWDLAPPGPFFYTWVGT